MRNPTVYLAGPIDGVDVNEAAHWRTQVAHRLNELGFTCYDPFTAFRPAPDQLMKAAGFINVVNENALRASGYFFLNLAANKMTIGSCRELDLAVRLKKPTIVVVPDARPWVSLHDATLVTVSLDEALRWFREQGLPNPDPFAQMTRKIVIPADVMGSSPYAAAQGDGG